MITDSLLQMHDNLEEVKWLTEVMQQPETLPSLSL